MSTRKGLLSFALALCVSTLGAQTVYSTSFEEFTANQTIVGQYGWLEFHLDNPANPNTCIIRTELARTGSKSAKVTPSNGATSSWWWKGVDHDTNGTGFIIVIWDMYLTASTLQGNYGIDMYTPDVDRIASVRVNFADQIEMVGFPGGLQEVITTSLTYTRNTWARFKAVLNYNTRTMELFVNGESAGSTEMNPAASNVFGDADIWHFNIGSDSNDSGYYDNLIILYSATTPVEGDVDGNGCVDDADLLAVLFAFGGNDVQADVNADGIVDDADLLTVLFNFGSGC